MFQDVILHRGEDAASCHHIVKKETKAVLNNSKLRLTNAAAHEQYADANRAVKKSVKTDQRYKEPG